MAALASRVYTDTMLLSNKMSNLSSYTEVKRDTKLSLIYSLVNKTDGTVGES